MKTISGKNNLDMKRFLKWFFLTLTLILLIGLAVVRFGMGMSMPEGRSGAEADALAQKMMERLRIESWQQTRFVSWTFPGGHSYVWDKSRNLIHVSWSDSEATLNTINKKGWARENGEVVSESDRERLLAHAWAIFCNDSFWLMAPFKAMDEGVSRELIDSEEGSALLVKYGKGGVTPGDSYLWYLNEDGLPYAYRMWVDIIPIPGLKVSWEDWQELSSGALIAQKHMIGPMDIGISELRSGSSLTEIGIQKSPFQP